MNRATLMGFAVLLVMNPVRLPAQQDKQKIVKDAEGAPKRVLAKEITWHHPSTWWDAQQRHGAFSPDMTLLAAAGPSEAKPLPPIGVIDNWHGISVYDLKTGKKISELRPLVEQKRIPGSEDLLNTTVGATASAFSPDMKKLAVAAIQLDQHRSFGETQLGFHRKAVHGFLIFAFGEDKGKTFVAPFVTKHKRPIIDIAFSPDKDKPRIATLSTDKSIKVWNTDGTEILSLENSSFQWESKIAEKRDTEAFQLGAWGRWNGWTILRFSPDGTRLVVRNPNGFVAVWDLQTKKELLTLHDIGCRAFSISPDNKLLAVNCHGTQIKVWEIKKQEEVWSSPKALSTFEDCAFSPDGNRLAITLTGHGADKRVGHARVFAVGTFKQTHELFAVYQGKESEANGLDAPIYFRPDGKTIQIGNQVWTLE